MKLRGEKVVLSPARPEPAKDSPAPFRFPGSIRFSRPAWVLVLAIAGYIAVISFLHFLRITRFMNGFDLAFYQQAIWNTGQGRFLEVSGTDFSHSLLGTDALFIYALMTPFYWLVPSTMTLLVVETVIVALGAVPVYWLAREIIGNRWAGLGFALIYLLLPAVQNGNLYELRERPMAGAFLLFAFWYWRQGRLGLFSLLAVLALCCRAENGLVLVMLGLYGWLEGRPRQPGYGWRFVLWPVALGISWLGLALLVIQVAAGGNGYALGINFAGGSPLAAPLNLLTNPALGWQQLFPTGAVLLGKLLYIPLLLLPFGFLPLLRPRPLLMALPPVGLNLLASESRKLQWNPFDYHYQGSVEPWLLVATICAVAWLAGRYESRSRWGKEKIALALVGIMLALTLTVNLATNLLIYDVEGVPRVSHGWGPILRARDKDARWDAARAMLGSVPANAPLAITNKWSSYVPPRRGLWLLADRPLYSRHPAQEAEYVFADLRDQSDAALVAQILAEGPWREINRQAEYVLLKRTEGGGLRTEE